MESISSVIYDKLYTTNEYGFTYQDVEAKLNDEEVEWLVNHYGLTTEYDNKVTGQSYKVHDMCINCQARQLLKYSSYKNSKSGKTGDKFHVRCEFVPAGLPAGSRAKLKRYIAENNQDPLQALRILKSTIDPVAWCELMFGFRDDNPNWCLRPYQKEQLRCSTLRYVIREGRRSGKTFAMALKLLYLAFNRLIDKGADAEGVEQKAGPEIMILTPYQSQVDNIFDEMEKILKRNKFLSRQVSNAKGGSLFVKTPFYHMDFQNGATISGFVTGVGVKQDGSGGGTIRGQNTDVIYMDEMDMIPDEILDKVVTPLLLTRPGVMMIATSTPIGKRSSFYEFCKDRPGFKEDYYPSTVLPHWDEVREEVEATSTQEAFDSEFMAHFIEGAHGVFKPTYVYNARASYTYKDSDISNGEWWRGAAGVQNRADLIKVIGIDWNKNAGSEFVVIAYDPNQHHWWVVEAVNVSASDYSSISFKQEVIRLNFKWKPDYIYADEGYGHHIIDDLKYEAYRLRGVAKLDKVQEQTKRLYDTLKKFNFSQKVDLKSPIDNTSFSKTGKEFLVENAVRVFEEGRIWFPEEDNVLLNQLMHYTVLRRHPSNNKPVYGPDSQKIGDHRLDAFMLALAGIFLEHNPLYSPRAMIPSTPSVLTKSMLDKRGRNLVERMTAGTMFRELQKIAPAIHPNILQIRRGDTDREDAAVRAALEAKQMVQSGRAGGWLREKSSRGDIGQRKDGVYEEMKRRTSQQGRGHSRDREDLYRVQEMSLSKPKIVRRSRFKATRKKFRS